MSFSEDWIASRRLFLLRLLVEVGGEANELVLFRALQRGGFARDGRDDLRADLDALRESACASEEWLDRLRVVRVTERGEDAAHGRVTVAGVERSAWRR